MPENNNIMSIEGQLIGMPLAGPESFSQQQLDYLKRALGVDETVLFENGDAYTKSATLSESISNFEYIRVRVDDDHHNGKWVLVDTDNAWAKWLGNYGYDDWDTTSNILGIRELGFKASGTTITSLRGFQKNAKLSGTSWGSEHQTGQYGGIVKVVGIHRIAGGN